jgi:hypothetical protein
MQSRYHFVGCPLFGLTIFTTARGHDPAIPNPSRRFLHVERRPSDERFLWLGRRWCAVLEPRHLRPTSPLFVIE